MLLRLVRMPRRRGGAATAGNARTILPIRAVWCLPLLGCHALAEATSCVASHREADHGARLGARTGVPGLVPQFPHRDRI